MEVEKIGKHQPTTPLSPVAEIQIFSLFVLLMQLMTVITTIDDLNYPEKTETYYIVNAPYIFSACWKVWIYCYIWIQMNLPLHTKALLCSVPFSSLTETRLKSNSFECWQVVKPLLQERTRRKIQVLQGNGRDELLKVRQLFQLTFLSAHSCNHLTIYFRMIWNTRTLKTGAAN